ncbi:Amidophosphoribosyltransferase [Heracleum sosnowskyi]|uniref:Amidophosphoribosyltransferase n=1 Tax=Heracleum sosnowskyi TaxID=360622 RepID=A0AAD8IP95_9APIA|nr:Amidophosphoribosyltransferase [Heracleum sosnowskyi]
MDNEIIDAQIVPGEWFRIAQLKSKCSYVRKNLVLPKNFPLSHGGKGFVEVMGHSALKPSIDPIQGTIYEERSSKPKESPGSSEGKRKTTYETPKAPKNDKNSIFEPHFIDPDDNFSKDSILEAHLTDPDDDFEYNDDKPREECGVVGIFVDPEASRLCYLALHALQQRGQEGAGIVTLNDKVLHSVTGVRLVSEVFDQSNLDQLPGDLAIGHVRYSTAGSSMLKNVQTFVTRYRYASVGVAHNGNLVNYQKLRNELEDNGSIFMTSSDTEVVLHLIAISKARSFFLRIVEACGKLGKLEGAYSMVFLTEEKLFAVRDPYWFRPLAMGRKSNGVVVFPWETCALDLIEAMYEREVDLGEVIVVDKTGVSRHFIC